MLSKNYVQFTYDGNLLKFYINRRDHSIIQDFLMLDGFNGDVEELVYRGITDLVGCLTSKHNISIGSIECAYFEGALLFFNNRLYRLGNLYIDRSSRLNRKPQDSRELTLFKNDVRCLVTINCTLTHPIFPI